MGYNTKFKGEFRLDHPLDDDTFDQLAAMDGPFDECDGYPSRWCQWTVGDDWQSIRWNGGEKFYGYIGWIRLLNKTFLAPNGYRIGGTVRFQGEEVGDGGRIVAIPPHWRCWSTFRPVRERTAYGGSVWWTFPHGTGSASCRSTFCCRSWTGNEGPEPD